MMIILMTNQMFFVMVLDYSDLVLVVSTPLLLFCWRVKGIFHLLISFHISPKFRSWWFKLNWNENWALGHISPFHHACQHISMRLSFFVYYSNSHVLYNIHSQSFPHSSFLSPQNVPSFSYLGLLVWYTVHSTLDSTDIINMKNVKEKNQGDFLRRLLSTSTFPSFPSLDFMAALHLLKLIYFTHRTDEICAYV